MSGTTALLGPPNEVITITFGGKTFRAGRRTAAHLVWTQQQLDRLHPGARLLVIQPCYNVGVEASEGTHDRDRVLDVMIDGLGWREAQGFLRAHGWAAWVREPPAFSWHIHMVSLGGNAPIGIFVPAQIDDYYRHTYGLKNQHNTDLDKSWFPGDHGAPPWPVGTPDQWRRAIDSTIFDFALWERELQDNMPYLDWPEKDRKALANDIADELLGRDIDPDKPKLTFRQALRQASNSPGVIRDEVAEVLARIKGKP